MATQPAEYVCDMDEYRGCWKVSVWPYVLAPVAIVALVVILAALFL